MIRSSLVPDARVSTPKTPPAEKPAATPAATSASVAQARLQDGFEGVKATPAPLATPTSCGTDICKAQASGGTELFDTEGPHPGEPSLSDIHQGGYGDCYFLSSLGALAQNDPDAVRNMIHDNGDGTYTVTFYQRHDNGPFGFDPGDIFGHSYEPVKITVSAKDIPDNAVSGSDSADGPVVDSKDGKQVIWPEVVEAAFAKLHDSHFLWMDKGNGYKNIGGGGWPQPVLEQLTGRDAQSFNPSDISAADLMKDFKSGKLLTICTKASDGEQSGYDQGKNPYGLIGAHAYTVTNVYMKNGQEYVTLNNPWGFDQPQDIPYSKLSGVTNDVAVGTVN